jgi:hypothetical protein
MGEDGDVKIRGMTAIKDRSGSVEGSFSNPAIGQRFDV